MSVPVSSRIILADEQIVPHRAIVGDEHFLEYGGHACQPRIARRGRCMAQHGNMAAVDRQDAGNDLGERALATAIAADDGVDLAEAGGKGAAIQRARYPKGLARVMDGDVGLDGGPRWCCVIPWQGRCRRLRLRRSIG
jgi:hypothetical protein